MQHSALPRSGGGLGRGSLWAALPSLLWLLASLGAALDHAFPPDLSRLSSIGTEILDRQDRPLALLPAAGGVWRFHAGTAPPLLTNLLIAVEDRRFWYHPGVDPIALARATAQLLRSGHVVSGGSTLAMQAARLLEPRPRTLRSKLIEMARALQLEARYGRQGVLDIWLTLAPFGGNLEGVRAGSLAWFGIPPEALEPAQAALLVAIPRRPERLRPDRHAVAAPRCATACWRSAFAPGCSTPLSHRCRPPASRCPAMRPNSPPRCRARRGSGPRWTCRCRRRWSVSAGSSCKACRGRPRSPSWWPMCGPARSVPCIPAHGATRRAPATSI